MINSNKKKGGSSDTEDIKITFTSTDKDGYNGEVNAAFGKEEETKFDGNVDPNDGITTVGSTQGGVITAQPQSGTVIVQEKDAEDRNEELVEDRETPKNCFEIIFDTIAYTFAFSAMITEIYYNVEVYNMSAILLENPCKDKFRTPWLAFTIAGGILATLQLGNMIGTTFKDLCHSGRLSLDVVYEGFLFNIFKNIPQAALAMYYIIACSCGYIGVSLFSGLSLNIFISLIVSLVRYSIRQVLRIRYIKYTFRKLARCCDETFCTWNCCCLCCKCEHCNYSCYCGNCCVECCSNGRCCGCQCFAKNCCGKKKKKTLVQRFSRLNTFLITFLSLAILGYMTIGLLYDFKQIPNDCARPPNPFLNF